AFVSCGDPAIGFDCGDVRVGPFRERRLNKAAAIGSNVEDARVRRKSDASEILLVCVGAKPFAVAQIAPVGASRDIGGFTRRAVDARQTLHQSTIGADMDTETTPRVLGLVGEFKLGAAAEIAGFGHLSLIPAKEFAASDEECRQTGLMDGEEAGTTIRKR